MTTVHALMVWSKNSDATCEATGLSMFMPKQILMGLNIVMWIGALASYYIEESYTDVGGFLWIGLFLALLHEFIDRGRGRGKSE